MTSTTSWQLKVQQQKNYNGLTILQDVYVEWQKSWLMTSTTFYIDMTIKGPTTEMLSGAHHFAGCLYRMAVVMIDDFHNIMTIEDRQLKMTCMYLMSFLVVSGMWSKAMGVLYICIKHSVSFAGYLTIVYCYHILNSCDFQQLNIIVK